MVLSEKEKNTINSLLKLDKRIFNIYKNLAQNKSNFILSKSLKILIENESRLIDSITIDSKDKFVAVLEFLKISNFKENSIPFICYNYNISDNTYHQARLLSRFYKKYTELEPLDLNVSIKPFLVNKECALFFNALFQESLKTVDQKQAADLRLKAYLTLIDSPYNEYEFLKNVSTESIKVIDSSKLLVDLLTYQVLKRAENAFNCTIVPLNNTFDDTYCQLSILLLDSYINQGLYKLLEILKNTGNDYQKSTLFLFWISYVKSLFAMISKNDRELKYQVIEYYISTRIDNIKEQTFYRNIYQEAKKDIEERMIPSIETIGIVPINNKMKI